MTPPPRQPGPVTSAQAAEILNVPLARVHRWISQGKVHTRGLIPGRGPGGMVRTFELEAFRDLADAYHRRHAAGGLQSTGGSGTVNANR